MPTEQEVRHVLKRLKKDGWQLDSSKESHVVARKDGHMLTVPTAKREIPIGTYRNIAKGAGWM